jgi:hypothetical protein
MKTFCIHITSKGSGRLSAATILADRAQAYEDNVALYLHGIYVGSVWLDDAEPSEELRELIDVTRAQEARGR